MLKYLFFFLPFICFSQTEIIFLDFFTKKPLQNVKIYQEKTFIGISDSKGLFTFNDLNSVFSVELENYSSKKILISEETSKLYLQPTTIPNQSIISIQEIVNQYVKTNSLENKKYKIYEKYSYNFITENKEKQLKTKEDSIIYDLEMKKLNYLDYIQEQVYFFDQQTNQKNIILEKNAGTNKSSFLEFNSSNFSLNNFKNDSILINKTYFLNPISTKGINYFTFFQYDKNEIHFYNSTTLGVIELNEDNTITTLIIEGNNENNAFLHIKFSKKLANIPEKISYKSHELKREIRINSLNITVLTNSKKEKNKIVKENNFNQYKFEKYNSKVEKYRFSTLSEKEKNTFKLEDDAIKKEKTIIFLNDLLFKQKITISKFEINPFEITSYNGYEGVRVQLGGGTSKKLYKSIKMSRYVAYGFQDRKIKFGSFFDYKISEKNNSVIDFGYVNDVNPAGRFSSNEKRNFNPLFSQVNNFNYNKYYAYQNFIAGFSTEYFDKFITNIGLNYQIIDPKFDYLYQNDNTFDKFTILSSKLNLFWSPNSKFVKTAYGKVTLKEDYPYFKLDIDKSWKAFETDFDFTKINFKAIYGTKTFKGETVATIKTGLILGNTPITHLYEGLGNAKDRRTIYERFGFSGVEVFETMVPGTFFTDKFISLGINHKFNSFTILRKNIAVSFLYRALLGTVSKENRLNNNTFNFDVPDQIYQEIGFEVPKIFLNKMIGFGAFYRLGYYSHKNFDENLFVKFTISFPNFQ